MSTISERQDAVNTVAEVGRTRSSVPDRSPEGDAFSAFAIAVIRLHGQLTAAGDALARPAGQSSARWQVLAGAEGGRSSVADVARLLGLARQSVQRVADLLESEGLDLLRRESAPPSCATAGPDRRRPDGSRVDPGRAGGLGERVRGRARRPASAGCHARPRGSARRARDAPKSALTGRTPDRG